MTALALSPLATLSRRRFQLTVRTPRELLVPLLTPIMFALVIAPSLKTALHTGTSYESYVAIGTIGLLIPLNTMFAGLGRELVELRVDGDASAALASLRSVGIAHDNAFTVGATVTVPLNGHSSREAIAAIHELGLADAVSARRPTLDDVYLRLTGGRLAEAA